MGECVGVWLFGPGARGNIDWLGDWDLGSTTVALDSCYLGGGYSDREGAEHGGFYGGYVLMCLGGQFAGRPSDRAS